MTAVSRQPHSEQGEYRQWRNPLKGNREHPQASVAAVPPHCREPCAEQSEMECHYEVKCRKTRFHPGTQKEVVYRLIVDLVIAAASQWVVSDPFECDRCLLGPCSGRRILERIPRPHCRRDGTLRVSQPNHKHQRRHCAGGLRRE